MNSGLMWYDPDPKKAASAKIEQAAERYLEKFGAEPNACHVSPAEPATHDRLRVVPNRWIRPGYFWLGYDEELPPAPRRMARDAPARKAASYPTRRPAVLPARVG